MRIRGFSIRSVGFVGSSDFFIILTIFWSSHKGNFGDQKSKIRFPSSPPSSHYFLRKLDVGGRVLGFNTSWPTPHHLARKSTIPGRIPKRDPILRLVKQKSRRLRKGRLNGQMICHKFGPTTTSLTHIQDIYIYMLYYVQTHEIYPIVKNANL